MKPNSYHISVVSLKDQTIIADKCHVAECFFERFKGLIGRTGLEPGQAMMFPRCNSIHMWFMSLTIDVVFLRAQGTAWRISSLHENVRPWKPLPLTDWRANATIELPAGTIRQAGLAPGDELCIS